MEDPWDSPWATNQTNTSLEPAPPRSTLELPGRTLTRQRSFSTQSPWATSDDGFSDWGAAESGLALPGPAPTSGGSIWGGWGGESASSSSQTQLTPRAREGSLGHGSHSPAWPAANSPVLAQGKTLSRRSSARSLYGHPSPDPWSLEAQNRLSLPTPALISAEQVAFSTLDRHDEEEEEDEQEGGLDGGMEDGPHPTTDLEETKTPGVAYLSDEEQGKEAKSDTKAYDLANKEEVIVEDQAKSTSRSRHSSFSDRSQHDDRPDSPITSMDEDSKDRPQIARRPSAQVIKELADTLDEFVKKTGDALTVPDMARGRQRSTSRGAMSIRSVRTDYASDFGDFEDAQSFNSAPTSRRPSFSGSPRPQSSRAGRTRSLSGTPRQGAGISSDTAPLAIPEKRGNRLQQLQEQFGPIKFTPDLESVDKLFDVAKLDAKQPSAKDYSLEHIDGIINDSFTSISERKTWWRVSRHGTMRKHDSGDDDNYRRVTWTNSKMREETNKIVRRWMEQDTYSGDRPSFGGAVSVKGGAFNWNSRAEPLSMDQVFGKRKSTQHLKAAPGPAPRPLSLQPQSRSYSHSRNLSTGVRSLPPRSPGVHSLPPPSPLSIPGPPMSPAFGWSTATNGSVSETPGSSRPPSRLFRQSIEVTSVNLANSRSDVASINEPESRNSFQVTPPPEPPSVSLEKPNDQVQEAEDEDDDDEWGEMVASPPSTSRPVSGFFDAALNGSLAEASSNKPTSPASTIDTRFTLDAVSSKLQQGQTAAKTEAAQEPPAAPAAHIWNFSAFDKTPQAPAAPISPVVPALPPTITSKPEFEFDTPLQSPALSGPSMTASPISAFQLPNPPTPTIPVILSRASSIASFQLPASPTPTIPLQPSVPPQSQHISNTSISSTVSSGPSRPSSPAARQMSRSPTSPIPFKPQHAQRSSLNMARPSPLQNVLTPKASSPQPMSPAVASPLKSVSFALDNGDELVAVRQIIDGLPDLSYMLR